MCRSKKYPYAPQGGSLDIPGGPRENSHATIILKETIKLNLNLQRGGRVSIKKPFVGGRVWILIGKTV